MQKRHSDRLLYFREQVFTTLRHVIPALKQFGTVGSGTRILEIGCGEGGNLKPFLDIGCRVTGIDLASNKIELARSFFSDHPGRDNLALICEDIYNLPSPEQKFDIVLMRDVIEHIHDQEKFMRFVHQFMHNQSLFSGVSALAESIWRTSAGLQKPDYSSIPLYSSLTRTCVPYPAAPGGENPLTVENLLEVKETGLSAERFEKYIRASAYKVLKRQFFLINPNYEGKFGLKPVRQCRLIARIPVLRNFLSTSVCYILTPG